MANKKKVTENTNPDIKVEVLLEPAEEVQVAAEPQYIPNIQEEKCIKELFDCIKANDKDRIISVIAEINNLKNLIDINRYFVIEKIDKFNSTTIYAVDHLQNLMNKDELTFKCYLNYLFLYQNKEAYNKFIEWYFSKNFRDLQKKNSIIKLAMLFKDFNTLTKLK